MCIVFNKQKECIKRSSTLNRNRLSIRHFPQSATSVFDNGKKTFISCEMKQLFFLQMKTWNLFSLFRLEDINIFAFSTFFLLLLIILRMGTIWFLFAESGSEMQSVIIHKHKSKKFLSLFILTMYFSSLSQNCIHSTFHSNYNRFANRFALNENADNFFCSEMARRALKLSHLAAKTKNKKTAQLWFSAFPSAFAFNI